MYSDPKAALAVEAHAVGGAGLHHAHDLRHVRPADEHADDLVQVGHAQPAIVSRLRVIGVQGSVITCNFT